MTPRHIWVVKLSQDFENPLKKKQDFEKTQKSAPVSISSGTQGVILIIRELPGDLFFCQVFLQHISHIV
jgi:hypothetical protein